MIRVLIVDDEYYSRKGLIRVIPWNDLNCSVVGDCENAIEVFQFLNNNEVDLIITDINMPEIDGIEMAKKIAKTNDKIKFIVITGFDKFKYAQGAVKINAVDFILKPIDIEEMKEGILKVVKLFEKEKEKNYRNILKDYVVSIGNKITNIERKSAKDEYKKLIRINKEVIVNISEFNIIFIKELYDYLNREVDCELYNSFKLEVNEKAVIDIIDSNIDFFREKEDKDNTIKKAVKAIEDRYCLDISLKEISDEFYINECYLSREIKNLLGIGFNDYVRKLRINKAKELLEKGEKVVAVAKKVGYRDYRQFTVNFKKETGILPKDI